MTKDIKTLSMAETKSYSMFAPPPPKTKCSKGFGHFEFVKACRCWVLEVCKNGHTKTAFTMAEVLITLMILGVIATLVIPSIVTRINKHQVEIRLKAAYLLVSKALSMAKTDNQMGIMGDLVREADQNDSNDKISNFFAENYLKPYLKFTKYCPYYDNSAMCTWEINSLDGSMISNGSAGIMSYKSRFLLNNGMLIGVMKYTSAIALFVDINGKNGPNKLGSDMFYFGLHSPGSGAHCDTSLDNPWCNHGKRIYASGIWDFEKSEEKDCSGAGFTCSAPIFRNSWKIPDDYPIQF